MHVDPEAKKPEEPAPGEKWASWTLTMVVSVDPEFAQTCAREIGCHEFFTPDEGSEMFDWHVRASDEDLAYLKLKYF